MSESAKNGISVNLIKVVKLLCQCPSAFGPPYYQMGLARYEIVMVECMHDIANHIDDILEELPNHLKEDKVKFTEMLDTHKAEKEKKRCCEKYCCN